jgi:hypothetical protein
VAIDASEANDEGASTLAVPPVFLWRAAKNNFSVAVRPQEIH